MTDTGGARSVSHLICIHRRCRAIRGQDCGQGQSQLLNWDKNGVVGRNDGMENLEVKNPITSLIAGWDMIENV